MSEYAVSVKHVSKKFKLYHEKRDTIFEAATLVCFRETRILKFYRH